MKLKLKKLSYTILISLSLLFLSQVAQANKFQGLWPWDRKATVLDYSEKSPFENYPTQKQIVLVQQIQKRIAEIIEAIHFENNVERKGELVMEAAYLQGYLDCLIKYKKEIFKNENTN